MSEETTEQTSPAPGERMDLPTWSRRKTKKRPQEDTGDAFQGSVRRAGKAAVKRMPLMIAGAVLLVGVVVAVVAVLEQGKESRAKDTKVLADGVAYQSRAQIADPEQVGKTEPPWPVVQDEAQRAAKVDEILTNLGQEAAGSDADISGELVRAAREMRTGKLAEAAETYRNFLAKAGDAHPMRFLATEGLGLALEAQGNLEDALVKFEELAGEEKAFYRDMALWHQGRVLEALERKDEAIAVYRKYNTEYPVSGNAMGHEQVRERLEALDPAALEAPVDADATKSADPAPAGGE
ncbi:MAG: tetratricopeptide repeat protein [Nannocystaceae bacterium]